MKVAELLTHLFYPTAKLMLQKLQKNNKKLPLCFGILTILLLLSTM